MRCVKRCAPARRRAPEYVSYRLDGSHYYVSASAQPLLNDKGETHRYVLMLHDITETVLRGAELAMQNERLTA